MSAISGYIDTIRNAIYGKDVRSAIVNALTQCYSDVNSPSLNTAAFTAALNAAYAGGILDIQTVTKISSMTNDKIIYRYNGTEAGKQKGLYYYSSLSNSWVLIGSEIQSVTLLSQMVEQNAIYRYTGNETGMVNGSIYAYNGTAWIPIGSAVLTAATVSRMTDTGAIYKYTGSKTGYITNALYYHDGSSWVPVYQPISKTLELLGNGSISIDLTSIDTLTGWIDQTLAITKTGEAQYGFFRVPLGAKQISVTAEENYTAYFVFLKEKPTSETTEAPVVINTVRNSVSDGKTTIMKIPFGTEYIGINLVSSGGIDRRPSNIDVYSASNEITGQIIPTIDDYYTVSLFVDGNGKWERESNGIIFSYIYPLPTSAKRINVIAQDGTSSAVSMITDDGNISKNENVSFAGNSSRMIIDAGSSLECDIPSDATKIVLTATTATGADRMPKAFYVLISSAETENATDEDEPKSWGQANLIARIKQMCNIKYTPVGSLPNQQGDFVANTEYVGLPYSSVRWQDKFIGIDVLFETFLTAVRNPRSVLYTKISPTTNSKTYYGVVCTSLVCYAFGLPYYRKGRLLALDENGYTPCTEYIIPTSAEYWGKMTLENVYSLELGDMLESADHAMIIIGIKRDEYKRITYVKTAEAWPPVCRINAWTSISDFIANYLNTYELWKYTDVDNVSYQQENNVVGFPDETLTEATIPDIMMEYGNKAVVGIGTNVTINVLNSTGYSEINIYRDNTLIDTKTTIEDFTMQNPSAGEYRITMTGTGKTATTRFIVVGYSCAYDSQSKIVSFSSPNAEPTHVTVYGPTGGNDSMATLSESDVESGEFDTTDLWEDLPEGAGRGVKVYFHTKWGNVAWFSNDLFV